MTPDPWQVQVATTVGDQLLCCHRQAGKSTVVAAVALADACTSENALILLISRSMRQSGELFRKVKQFYNLTRPIPLVQDSVLSMELANGSRIVSLPGTEETIVGYSAVKRLILDEASRILDPTYYALRPMLAISKGTLIALSTPYGRRGFFYEAWADLGADATPLDTETVEALLADLGMVVAGEDLDMVEGAQQTYAWAKTQITAPENPRLSRRFLANERRLIPDLWFRQEWLCEFLEVGDQVFRYEDLEAMLTTNVLPLFSGKPLDMPGRPTFRDDVEPLTAGNGVWGRKDGNT